MNKFSSAPTTTLLDTTIVGQPWQKAFRLGMGIDAITGQLRASAVKPFTVKPEKPLKPEFIYSLVQSESDMQSMISGSMKAAYNLEGAGTVSASTSFLDELAVSELAVTLVAQVSVVESQYALAPKYELDVQPGKDFRDKYGDYFVAGYRASSSLYVVYQCRFSSAEQRSKFTTSLAADVPQVFSAEGSASFEKTSKQYSASVSIRISATGVSSPIPTPPSSGWTPENIVSVLLPWFNNSMAMDPLDTYLEHYRLIDPTISGEVPVSPDIFWQLNFLYNRFWLVRALFNTCPDFGRRLVEERYHKLKAEIEANQASLPSDPAKIEQLTNAVQSLLQSLREIFNRQVFYTQAIAAAKTEPPANQNFDADKGRVHWSYGFQKGDMPGVEIIGIGDRVAQDYKIGWREHVFSYRDSTKMIVGLDVTCNRTDGWGGDWHKVSEQIIGRSGGDVYVKSDYDRGYDWSIVWYVVEANLYPAGPWSEGGTHAPEFLSAAKLDGKDAALLWTPERMAAARPIDRSITTNDRLPEAGRSIVGGGGATNGTRLRGTKPSEGQLRVGPITSQVQNPQGYPDRTVGKLFFNMGGQSYVASAVVVHRSGILTAAHCLRLNGQEASDIVFIPAWHGGEAPFGIWSIDRFYWPNSWAQTQEPAWDVGFCTVRPRQDGICVGDVVGWAGLAWGSIAGCWNNMGYPVQAIPNFPFDGAEPWQSLGSQVDIVAPSTVAKLDNLTAGGSGGPWFAADNANIVNGVFSQFNIELQRNIGPYFADWVGEFFHGVFGQSQNLRHNRLWEETLSNWTQVFVTPKDGGQALLSEGTGCGDMKVFACGKFPYGVRPVKNDKYIIQAHEDGVQFPMDWEATCTFSGETSEFKQLGTGPK